VTTDLRDADSASRLHDKRERVLVYLCSALGLVAAALLHWQHRFSVNPDGVSYFEMARLYGAGEWRDAVNVIWSPLYAWLLVPIVSHFDDRRLQALEAARALQAACVLFSLWTASRIPGMSRTVLGAALFGAVVLIPVGYVTPDLLAMALTFWMMARLSDDLEAGRNPRQYVGTGMLAGLGYLAKSHIAAYFTLLLVLCWCASDRPSRVPGRFRAYVAGFMVVAVPWVALLSIAEGRFTIGEAGTVNVLSHGLFRDTGHTVGRVGAFVRLHELPFATAMPEHYEPVPKFVGPYQIDVFHITRLLALNGHATLFGYYPADFPLHWPLAAIGLLSIAAFSSRSREDVVAARQARFLSTAGAAGILLFVASHVESRYLAPFPAVLLAGIACRVAISEDVSRRRLATVVSALGLAFWLLPVWVLVHSARTSPSAALDLNQKKALTTWMREHGVRYAVVGPTYELGLSAWAAKAQLVASVDPDGLTQEWCQDVTRSLALVKTDVLVARSAFASCGRWTEIPGSAWFWWDHR
jgi:hypothetical protein